MQVKEKQKNRKDSRKKERKNCLIDKLLYMKKKEKITE